jgi:anti-sigma factor RsiW
VIDVDKDPERIRDFLAGRLSAREHAAFTKRLGKDPELVREVELSARLIEGMRSLGDRGRTERLRARLDPSNRSLERVRALLLGCADESGPAVAHVRAKRLRGR